MEDEFFVLCPQHNCSLRTGKMLMGHLPSGSNFFSPHLHLLPSSIDPVTLANIQLGTPSAKSNPWFPPRPHRPCHGGLHWLVPPQPVELGPYVVPIGAMLRQMDTWDLGQDPTPKVTHSVELRKHPLGNPIKSRLQQRCLHCSICCQVSLKNQSCLLKFV